VPTGAQGRDLRVSASPWRGGVGLSGTGRVATLMPLLRFAKALRVYGPADGSSTTGAWELELPGREQVAELNRRLTAARALVAAGAVLLLPGDAAEVTTGGGVRRVGLGGGECTCPWWFDHRGSRGPCKHVLAARIAARVAVGVTS
jgi:hypothetical protein